MKDMERISVLLQKQKELEKEQHEEFEHIADECEREGYPSHGSNYSLRVEQINREYNKRSKIAHTFRRWVELRQN